MLIGGKAMVRYYIYVWGKMTEYYSITMYNYKYGFYNCT